MKFSTVIYTLDTLDCIMHIVLYSLVLYLLVSETYYYYLWRQF